RRSAPRRRTGWGSTRAPHRRPHMRTPRMLLAAAAALSTASGLLAQSGVGWSFTYQGQLNVSGQPATGAYDLQFRLFDSTSLGTQVGPTVQVPAVSISRGLFTQS